MMSGGIVALPYGRASDTVATGSGLQKRQQVAALQTRSRAPAR
jgi:hypothetical protein